MDKKVFVSEAEVVFWGSVCPSDDLAPKCVYRTKFVGKSVEVYVYDFPKSDDILHFRSIEQNLAIGIHEPMSPEVLNRPVRHGYRIFAYSALEKSCDEVLKYAHSALQFARCFKVPPKHRGSGPVPDHLVKMQTMHAERLQHMSGIRNMTTKELKKRLCDRRTYGITFGHFVIQACRRGIFQMPVEALRLWLVGAFDVGAVSKFMSDGDYRFGLNLCIFCHVRVARPALCTVKLGSRWAQVELRVNDTSRHPKEIDLNEITNEGVSIVFEVEHIIRYHPTEMVQLHDIRLARIIRWFHRMLKCILFDLFSSDQQYAERVMATLQRTVQCMTWEPQDCGILFRVLRAIKERSQCFGLDVTLCCMHMTECMRYLDQDRGKLSGEQTDVLKLLARERVIALLYGWSVSCVDGVLNLVCSPKG